MRTAISLLDAMSDKYAFMQQIEMENINHEEFINLVLELINIFEDSPDISKLRVNFNAKCLNHFGQNLNATELALQRSCVNILYSYVTIEKQRDLIMGRTINLVKKAEVLNDKDVQKKVELNQLIAALTSVQKRRRSILVNWIDSGLINRPNDTGGKIKCTIFNCGDKESLDLWPNNNGEDFRNYTVNTLKVDVNTKDCGSKYQYKVYSNH